MGSLSAACCGSSACACACEQALARRIAGSMRADSKLVFLIRHGQAVSNFLSDSLGPDIWFNLEDQCSYTDDNGTYWGIFDAGGLRLAHTCSDSSNRMSMHQ